MRSPMPIRFVLFRMIPIAIVLISVSGCTAVDPGNLAIFLRDLSREALAAYLF